MDKLKEYVLLNLSCIYLFPFVNLKLPLLPSQPLHSLGDKSVLSVS